MVPRNDSNGIDEITGTTARWFTANAIAISRAEFEKLRAIEKRRAATDNQSSTSRSQPKPQQFARYFASVAPSMMNATEDESPTLMWHPSHASATAKDISPKKRESAAKAGRVPSLATRTRRAVPPPTPSTSKRRAVIDGSRPQLQNPVSVNPPGKAAAKSSTSPDTPGGPARSVLPIYDSSDRGTKPVLREELATVVSKNINPSDERIPVNVRPQPATSPIKWPGIRTARSRVWIWNTASIAALFVLVLVGRFLIATSPVTPSQAPVPVADTKVRSDIVGVKVEALGTSVTSDATAASAVIRATSEPIRVLPASADRAIQGVQINKGNVRMRTTVASRSPRAAAPTTETSETGTLRVNSRPWSQVFVDGNLVGNTPQMGLKLSAGHHTVKLVNESLGFGKTLEVDLEPGQTLTRIINLIE